MQNQALTVVIESGESLSGAFDVRQYSQMGIIMPAARTAANLTFQASDESGGTYCDVYTDAGDEVSVTAAASRAISIDLNSSALASYQYLKIRSGTTGTPVAQGADRTLKICLKEG